MTKNHLNNIFLIGFMASGKSTLGKKLSKYLDYDFIDTDKLIEQENSKTISQIFENEGEKVFRNYEKNTLNKLLSQPTNKVVSTGGGLPYDKENLDLMLNNGLVVFLELDIKSVINRVKASKNRRPLLTNLNDEELIKKINNLYQQRESFYKQAHITINALNIRSIDLKKLSKELFIFSK